MVRYAPPRRAQGRGLGFEPAVRKTCVGRKLIPALRWSAIMLHAIDLCDDTSQTHLWEVLSLSEGPVPG